ncbi:MAG: nucleotidyl transferase AbiEii/AbiGii toxin family protein [Ginsengibacter sp.]
MLYYETVDRSTLELLTQLQSIDLFKDLRLVGGTSLALQIGHRKSIDLDLFGNIDVDVLEINNALSGAGNVTQLKDSKNIHIYLVNGIKVDIVNYTYPWLQGMIDDEGIRLASCEDIAAMKLAAIAGRGTKKDFIDLFFLLKHLSLNRMLQLYQEKYSDGSLFMVLKSLIYFEDADLDLMPDMLIPLEWKVVKEVVIAAHKEYVSNDERQ